MKKGILRIVTVAVFLVAAHLVWNHAGFRNGEVSDASYAPSRRVRPGNRNEQSNPLLPAKERLQNRHVKIAQDKPLASPAATVSAHEVEKECWRRLGLDSGGNFDNFVSQLTSVGEWYFNPSSLLTDVYEESSSGKFLLALALAGELDGIDLPQRDIAQAIQLLSEVAALDPENSGPLLYLAALQHQSGKVDESRQTLAAIHDTSKFDTYLKALSLELFRNAKSTSELISAKALWSRIPTPKYQLVKKLIQREGLQNITYQLLSDGLTSNGQLWDTDWVPIEYAIGYSLLPSSEAAGYPRYSELLRKAEATNPLATDQVISVLRQSCDLSSLESNVAQVRERFE